MVAPLFEIPETWSSGSLKFRELGNLKFRELRNSGTSELDVPGTSELGNSLSGVPDKLDAQT